jgi:lysozyme
MTISEAEAEALLVKDLKRFEDAVNRLITVDINQNEFDAIVSFAFNCGNGALEESTFRRRINSGEDKALCFQEEFVRWTNGGLPGLVRRRQAEIDLATS